MNSCCAARVPSSQTQTSQLGSRLRSLTRPKTRRPQCRPRWSRYRPAERRHRGVARRLLQLPRQDPPHARRRRVGLARILDARRRSRPALRSHHVPRREAPGVRVRRRLERAARGRRQRVAALALGGVVRVVRRRRAAARRRHAGAAARPAPPAAAATAAAPPRSSSPFACFSTMLAEPINSPAATADHSRRPRGARHVSPTYGSRWWCRACTKS